MKSTSQTYNDGLVNVYKIVDTSLAGRMPKEEIVFNQTLNYDEQKVGMIRFYTALQNNVKVENVIRCPRRPDVLAGDIAIPIDGNQYRIAQVQYPQDIDPKSMDLTLEKVGVLYDIG